MIKKFRLSYLEDILEIEKDAFPKTPYDKFTFLRLAQAYPDSFLVYINEENEEIVGYIVFTSEGHILSVAVKSLYRRKGIGTRLVKHVLQKSNGSAWVEVREGNGQAQQFYRVLGFTQTDRVSQYYGEEDAIVMSY